MTGASRRPPSENPGADPAPFVLAHRGGAREAPENTLAALAHAVDVGADGVELDVRLAADGVAVVFHDDDLGRFARPASPIGACDWPALRGLDLGARRRRFRGQRIPRLDEALAVVATMARVNLEIKPCGDAAALVAAVTRAIDAASLGPSLMITSFDPSTVDAVAAARPDLARGLVLAAPPTDEAWRAHPLVSLSCGLAKRGFARQARDAGLRVVVWTENDPRRIGYWLRLGVEGIITDRPARFVAARGPRGLRDPRGGG